ncbi:hypothetical protein H072_3768 [Dactylellina haptotyla CBS 200.50]|uniref:Uncharacterized protein n=1 Tax=Dactylellina haptotyla (strain CBS 200.50) TaxID=1284197 RepID=S8AMD8_DACHA|nr:hypothetical protein H072_3768 [Dactylellina haptotyla CBS 200.50]
MPPQLARFDFYVYIVSRHWWKFYNLSSEILELMSLFFGPPNEDEKLDESDNPSHWRWDDVRISISLADIQNDDEKMEVVETREFASQKIFDYSILIIPTASDFRLLHRIFLPNQRDKDIIYDKSIELAIVQLAQKLPALLKIIWCMEEFPLRSDGIEPRSEWCLWSIVRKEGYPLSVDKGEWISPEEIIEMHDPFFDGEVPPLMELPEIHQPTRLTNIYEELEEGEEGDED